MKDFEKAESALCFCQLCGIEPKLGNHLLLATISNLSTVIFHVNCMHTLTLVTLASPGQHRPIFSRVLSSGTGAEKPAKGGLPS